ncbi:N-acetyltransferase 10, partial [Irineochytrium annulatum]
ALSSLSRGIRASGDLIPWVLTQQFQDDEFASLSGARVVRVATHPDFIGKGYGSCAIRKLEEYYEGKVVGTGEQEVREEMKRVTDEELEANGGLMGDDIKVRDPSKMPPLLMRLDERPARERLHWLGVSFGLTPQLQRFWKRQGFVPVYVAQTSNEITGEHTSIMVRSLARGADDGANVGDEEVIVRDDWVGPFAWDFRRRLVELLGYGSFLQFEPLLVLSMLEACNRGRPSSEPSLTTRAELHRHLTPHDLKRLESYTQNMLDYHVVTDLLPTLAKLFFMGALEAPSSGSSERSLKSVHLSPVQAAILLSLGLQRRTMEETAPKVGLPVSQVMALFGKVVKKCSVYFQAVEERGMEEEEEEVGSAKKAKKGKKAKKVDRMEVDEEDSAEEAEEEEEEETSVEKGKKATKRRIDDEAAWDPTSKNLDDDLEEAGEEAMSDWRRKQRELIDELNPTQYAIDRSADAELEELDPKALGRKGAVQVKSEKSSKRKRLDEAAGTAEKLAKGIKGEQSGIFDPQAAAGKTEKFAKGQSRGTAGPGKGKARKVLGNKK